MNSRTTIQTAALLALAAKLICAALTLGTNDADAFYNFGRFIWERGLLPQYGSNPEFNHTPATGGYVALIYGLGQGFGFNFFLRLPGILADFAVVRALLRWRESSGQLPTWALMLLALSPVSFMVSGFHGNVDSVLVWLLVLAALECGAGRAAWCGLWFGLACNVKIIPLLVAPVFFFHWLARGGARRFFLVAALTIFAGWAYPLCTMPETFLRNVLGYNSNWGAWGITYWLSQTRAAVFVPTGFSGLTAVQLAIMSALKIIIVAAALGIAWRSRTRAPEHVFATLALVWAVFFVFAPGVGAQYLVWFAPFLLIRAPGWYAVTTAASSIFLFVFYDTICGGLPWYHGASTRELLPEWAGWSNLPWLTLAVFLAVVIRRASGARDYSSPSS